MISMAASRKTADVRYIHTSRQNFTPLLSPAALALINFLFRQRKYLASNGFCLLLQFLSIIENRAFYNNLSGHDKSI